MMNENVNDYRIPELIEECRKRSEHHKINAKNSLSWHNFLSIVGVIIAGAQTVFMTSLAVFDTDAGSVAIVGSVFALVIIVFNRVLTSFKFETLNVLHNSMSDDYIELIRDFNYIDIHNFDINVYNLHTHRMTSVIEKGHLQEVKTCPMLECCC